MRKKFLTPDQAAERMAVPREVVTEWLRQGRLHGVRAGKLWRIREEDLEAFLNGENPRDKDSDEKT